MSARYGAPLISGKLVYGVPDVGILGSVIRATTGSGADGPGLLYNDWDSSADDTKYFRALVVSGAPAGSFFYEDGSFEIPSGTAAGTYTITYALYVDGVSQGSSTATVTIAYVTVSNDLVITYSVGGAASPVSNDLALSYPVLSAVQANLALAYNIQSAVQSNLALAYAINSAVQSDLALAYSIGSSTSPVSNDLPMAYSVLGAAQSDLALSYVVNASVQANLALTYPITSGVQADLALAYSVAAAAASVSNDLLLTYNVIGSVQNSLALSYAILGEVTEEMPRSRAQIRMGQSLMRRLKNCTVSYAGGSVAGHCINLLQDPVLGEAAVQARNITVRVLELDLAGAVLREGDPLQIASEITALAGPKKVAAVRRELNTGTLLLELRK